MESPRWFYLVVEVKPVGASNASKPWSRFQVVILPLLTFTTLVPGDNQTKSTSKKGKIEVVQS